MTLDRQYMQMISVAGLADAIDVTDDGSLLYDANNELREMNKAGTIRTIWSCRTAFGASFNCYSNTVNWSAADDTVLMSFPEPNTVAQINRQTGALVATYGDRTGSYTFSPTTWSFEFQHFPNITAAGTLILSTHLSAYPHRSPAGPMHHAFVEFEIDRTNRRLVEKWSYTQGTEWTWAKGMAIRLPNGNTLAQLRHRRRDPRDHARQADRLPREVRRADGRRLLQQDGRPQRADQRPVCVERRWSAMRRLQ